MAADPLSDRFCSSPSPDLADTDNPRSLALCFSACARLATAAAAAAGRLLSVTLHLILRALHRARHFYAAAMTSARQKGTKGIPVTAARRKLTAAAATPYGCSGDAYARGPGAAVGISQAAAARAFNDRS